LTAAFAGRPNFGVKVSRPEAGRQPSYLGRRQRDGGFGTRAWPRSLHREPLDGRRERYRGTSHR